MFCNCLCFMLPLLYWKIQLRLRFGNSFLFFRTFGCVYIDIQIKFARLPLILYVFFVFFVIITGWTYTYTLNHTQDCYKFSIQPYNGFSSIPPSLLNFASIWFQENKFYLLYTLLLRNQISDYSCHAFNSTNVQAVLLYKRREKPQIHHFQTKRI